ncbi:hypothetical protein P9X10_02645 [Bacillus cereus]|nr:hypothetical protein [Bacillus cereus]
MKQESIIVELRDREEMLGEETNEWYQKKELMFQYFSQLTRKIEDEGANDVPEFFNRRLVKINWERFDLWSESLDEDDRAEAFARFKQMIRRSSKKKSIHQDFNILVGTEIPIDFNSLIKLIFETNNGRVEVKDIRGNYKEVLTQEDYEYIKYFQDRKDKASDFFSIVRHLGYNPHAENRPSMIALPINKATKDFIHMKSGQTLITMKFKSPTDSGRRKMKRMIAEVVTKAYEVGEVVNSSYEGYTSVLGVLIGNESIKDFLTRFEQVYRLYEKGLRHEDFMVEFVIEENISQVNKLIKKESWFYIINVEGLQGIEEDFDYDRTHQELGMKIYS